MYGSKHHRNRQNIVLFGHALRNSPSACEKAGLSMSIITNGSTILSRHFWHAHVSPSLPFPGSSSKDKSFWQAGRKKTNIFASSLKSSPSAVRSHLSPLISFPLPSIPSSLPIQLFQIHFCSFFIHSETFRNRLFHSDLPFNPFHWFPPASPPCLCLFSAL